MQVTSFNQDAIFNDERVAVKILLESSFSKEIRIMLKKGQIMKEHKAPYPIIVHILEGEIDFGLSDEVHNLKKGEIITLEAKVLHDLKAKRDSIVRLTLSKSDQLGRVQNIVNHFKPSVSNQVKDVKQGHWVLAKMGKRVLRPGGKELTQKLVKHLNINSDDNIVEFAPGLGFTASLTLKYHPKSYTGIEINEEAASILKKSIEGENRRIILGSADNSNLKEESVNKVYGEAMLTMQTDRKKANIIGEAYRILKPGGLYAIHELGLIPNEISPNKKDEVQRKLAETIKVNARPLTVYEWSILLEDKGFEVVNVETNSMRLLEPKRMIDDEGIFRAMKIAFNILVHPKERKQILKMRKVFRTYKEHLNAVMIIAKKKKDT